MITLTTAVPGAGKTLRIVGELLALRDEERKHEKPQRLIFTNINGLDPSLNCCLIEDGRDWIKVPEGSLVVLDECQRFFPPRSSGAKAPDYVQFFDTHRHQGIDIWLLTQHPKMIDGFIRGLVGYHRHGYRPYGLSYAIWSEFQCCNENPPMPSKPEKKKINHDKRVFGLYKSSVEHTHKARHPWRIYSTLALSIAFVSALSFVVYQRLTPPDVKKTESVKIESQKSATKSEPALKSGSVTIPETPPASASISQSVSSPVAVEKVLIYQGWAKNSEGEAIIVLCNQLIDRGCADPASVYKLSDFGAFRVRGGVLQLFMSTTDDLPTYIVNNPKLIADARDLGINI